MTFEELEQLVMELQSDLKTVHDLSFKNITEFDQLPALDFSDSLIAVTDADYTGKVTIEQIMEYLNKNLKNFICWKPVVENDTLSWERSSNDESPASLNFADIKYPMASEDRNGMMSSEDFIKLAAIDEENIVYSDALTEILKSYSTTNHEHDQYQLKAEMPTKLSDFDNDLKLITTDDIPTKVSAFENDANYLTIDVVPVVTNEQPGFMSPALLGMFGEIYDDYVTNEALEEAVPTKVSELENDANYLIADNIYTVFGELGVVNLIKNSEFQFTTNGLINDWSITNGTMEQCTDEADIPYCGKIEFTSDTTLGAKFGVSPGIVNTVTFIAKSSESATYEIAIGDGHAVFTIGTTWSKYTAVIVDNGTNPSMYMNFSLIDENVTSSTLYITQVKVEKGALASEYIPSYSDIKSLVKFPATLEDYGAVIPDGETLDFDTDGKLRVAPKALNDIRIDDENVSDASVYSSSKVESRIATKAPIEDGKIPAEYLPAYVDDAIEGRMETEEDGTRVFIIDDGQYGPSEPSKGIIYVDTRTNLIYRWTGATYACIGGQDDNSVAVNVAMRKDILISENTTTVEVPSYMYNDNALTVYYNGLLMARNINYTVSDSIVTPIDFEFEKDSVVTMLYNVIETNLPASGIDLDNAEDKFGGNDNIQSGMEYLSDQILTLQANKEIGTTGVLVASNWTDNKQTISVDKVTSSNTIIVCPAPENTSEYGRSGVICTSQNDGTLTFECTTVPEIDITVNILIFCQ